MPKSLGEKRKRVPGAAIDEITRWYADFAETETSKVFDNDAFGFRRVTVERPLRVRLDIDGADARLDAHVDKLGGDVVAAFTQQLRSGITVAAGTPVADAAAQLGKALPKL